MSTPAYLIGRAQRVLNLDESVLTYSDTLFASQRLDEQTLSGLSFEHTTFANISFRKSTIVDCTFEDCVFASGYLKGVRIETPERGVVPTVTAQADLFWCATLYSSRSCCFLFFCT